MDWDELAAAIAAAEGSPGPLDESREELAAPGFSETETSQREESFPSTIRKSTADPEAEKRCRGETRSRSPPAPRRESGSTRARHLRDDGSRSPSSPEKQDLEEEEEEEALADDFPSPRASLSPRLALAEMQLEAARMRLESEASAAELEAGGSFSFRDRGGLDWTPYGHDEAAELRNSAAEVRAEELASELAREKKCCRDASVALGVAARKIAALNRDLAAARAEVSTGRAPVLWGWSWLPLILTLGSTLVAGSLLVERQLLRDRGPPASPAMDTAGEDPPMAVQCSDAVPLGSVIPSEGENGSGSLPRPAPSKVAEAPAQSWLNLAL